MFQHNNQFMTFCFFPFIIFFTRVSSYYNIFSFSIYFLLFCFFSYSFLGPYLCYWRLIFQEYSNEQEEHLYRRSITAHLYGLNASILNSRLHGRRLLLPQLCEAMHLLNSRLHGRRQRFHWQYHCLCILNSRLHGRRLERFRH